MKHSNIKRLFVTLVLILFILISICIKRPSEYVYAEESNSHLVIEEAEITVEPEEVVPLQEDPFIRKRYLKLMEELDTTNDLLDWYLRYKRYTERLEDRPETICDYYSDAELTKIFGVVQAEIGSDCYTFEQKCNVASVIFNRIDHDMFGDDVASVLTANQFSTVASGAWRNTPSQETILACEFAFAIKDTTDGCIGFQSGSKLNSWNGWTFAFYDGAHYFYKMNE